jgi:predicted dehydrogenase
MDSHLEIIKEACKYKIKGIFLEKPISDTLENAAEIIRLCKKNKIKLQVDHQRRFSPFYQEVKKLINQDKFGNIQHASIYYGAGISNTGSHLFDLMRYFFGDIEWVEGIFSNNSSHKPNDPNIDGIITFKNKRKCFLHSFDVNNFGILEFDIVGTKARIRLNLVLDRAEYFEISEEREGLLYKELSQKPFEIKKVDSIVLGLEDLLKCIENDKEPLCTGMDGYCSIEAINAIIHSANDNGRRTYLPIDVDSYNIATSRV